jgi:thiamine-monophosphate kinase
MRLMDEVLENRTLGRWAERLPRAPGQVGGLHEADAELLPLGDGRLLALTVDTVDEEVRLGLYTSAFTVGRTAAVAALSDLAAVGAVPMGLLLSAGLPVGSGPEVQDALARGVADACRDAGTHVVGGDTNETAALSVTCVGAGLVPAEAVLLRVGLRPGDLLFASGPLGLGSALAAARLVSAPSGVFPEERYRPRVRTAHGRALRGIASACMDTSDGLLATLDQLARLNGVAVRIERPLPELLDPDAEAVRRQLGLSAFAFLAGNHGEFELVFGVPPRRIPDLERAAAALAWRPLGLGRVERGGGLWAGDEAIDGAWVRNLLAEVGGDLPAYLRALSAVEL